MAGSISGLDLVVEGDAVRVTDEAKLRKIGAAYESKYGREWHFDVRDRARVLRLRGHC